MLSEAWADAWAGFWPGAKISEKPGRMLTRQFRVDSVSNIFFFASEPSAGGVPLIQRVAQSGDFKTGSAVGPQSAV